MLGRVEVYLRQYSEVAGIAWGQERMGPLMNMIGGTWGQPFISCFCPHCRKKARDRGLSVDRAQRGYLELERLLAAARRDERPADGYFVSFWRLLSKYPEILGWEKLWTDSYHEIRAEVYRRSKSIAPEKPLGFHILHNATLSPLYRAEEDYAETATYADFVKPAVYHIVGGGRMALFLERLSTTIFHDARPEDVLPFYYKIMNYEEAPHAELPATGLSADYVARETKRHRRRQWQDRGLSWHRRGRAGQGPREADYTGGCPGCRQSRLRRRRAGRGPLAQILGDEARQPRGRRTGCARGGG